LEIVRKRINISVPKLFEFFSFFRYGNYHLKVRTLATCCGVFGGPQPHHCFNNVVNCNVCVIQMNSVDMLDKISLSSSEADSGVSSDVSLPPCSDVSLPPRSSHGSGPVSSSSSLTTLLVPERRLVSRGASVGLRCPMCSLWVDVDHGSVESLTRNHALERVLIKYDLSRRVFDGQGAAVKQCVLSYNCQLCPDTESIVLTSGSDMTAVRATVGCQQCRVLYCDACRQRCVYLI